MSHRQLHRSLRRYPRLRLGWVLAAAVLAAAVTATSAAAADVKAVSGAATGVSVTGDLGVISPTPTVSLSADESSPPSASGPFTESAPSVTLASPLPFNVFSTGALTVTTGAGNLMGGGNEGFVEAEALVQNVVLGPNFATASSLASSCRADGDGARGTTVIEGGMLNGQPFPPTPTPAPNTVIPLEGLGTVTLNEQVVSAGAGPGTTTKVVVNAVHARFSSGTGGILPANQTAEIIIGQVTCESTRGDTGALPPATVSPTTPAPAVTSPPGAGRPLASTGSDDNLLGLGLLALGLGGLLRMALRSRRSRS